ncbi:hypothetical protein ACFY19_20875 [Streptosporangium saharense]|uniref:hypothetical protein n=1 Tax=Streptosporangium saharense TaxID=1706840 RepID=UPI003682DCCB
MNSRFVASYGPRRRLEALVAAGWPVTALELRLKRRHLFYRLQHQAKTRRETAQAVAALYDELWCQVPPDTQASRAARARAARKGWPRPLEWDDEWLDLAPEDLADVVAREVRWMPETDLRRCWHARYRHGDRSPVTIVAAREWDRRKAARARGRRAALVLQPAA